MIKRYFKNIATISCVWTLFGSQQLTELGKKVDVKIFVKCWPLCTWAVLTVREWVQQKPVPQRRVPSTEQGPPAHDSLRESWFYFMRCMILWGPLSHSNIDSPDSFYEFTYRDRGTSRRGMQSLVRRRLDLWEPRMYRQRQTNCSW